MGSQTHAMHMQVRDSEGLFSPGPCELVITKPMNYRTIMADSSLTPDPIVPDATRYKDNTPTLVYRCK